jgi:translation initiation factor IF-1
MCFYKIKKIKILKNDNVVTEFWYTFLKIGYNELN